MKENRTALPARNPDPAGEPPTAVREHWFRMPFRIVGPDRHQSVAGGRTFTCVRECTTSDAGIAIRWAAFNDDLLLKADCRTLNEAKNICRSAMISGADVLLSSQSATRATPPAPSKSLETPLT